MKSSTSENDGLFSMRPIYHGYSGEQNEEMNMVLYGCNRETSDGEKGVFILLDYLQAAVLSEKNWF